MRPQLSGSQVATQRCRRRFALSPQGYVTQERTNCSSSTQSPAQTHNTVHRVFRVSMAASRIGDKEQTTPVSSLDSHSPLLCHQSGCPDKHVQQPKNSHHYTKTAYSRVLLPNWPVATPIPLSSFSPHAQASRTPGHRRAQNPQLRRARTLGAARLEASATCPTHDSHAHLEQGIIPVLVVSSHIELYM